MNKETSRHYSSSRRNLGRFCGVRSFGVGALIVVVGFLVGVSVFAVFGESGVEAQGQEAG